MSEQVEINFLLTAEVGRLQTQLSRVEGSIVRIFSYIRQFGVGEDLNNVIRKMQQMITVARSLQLVLLGVRMAMSPVGGWTAWLYTGTAVVGAGFAATDMMMGLG